MGKKRRQGLAGFPATFTQETLRNLRWIKHRKGGSINQRVVAGTEEAIKQILKDIGEPPVDFE